MVIVAGVCALLTVTLGLLPAPSGVDDVAAHAVGGWPRWLLDVLVLPTEPYVLLPVLALLVVRCRKRPWEAVFVVLAPGLALAATTWVLKPLFDRWKEGTLVYPSGHTVSLVATLVVVFFLADHARIVVIVGGVSLLAATAGMVGLGYHFLTDIAGGVCFAVFAVLVVWGLLSWLHTGRGAEYRWSVVSRHR